MNDDIDDLLDGELDDIDDLPEFKPFPDGSYILSVSMEEKDVNGHQSIELSLKCKEVVEVDAAAEAPRVGDTSSVLFMMDNEFGRGKFKAVARNFVEFAGTKNTRAIVEAVTEVECVAILGIRIDKKDTSKLYQNILEIAVN